MNITESKIEEQIRNISEKSNPYHSDCPNKQLWSEGFRAGVKYATDWIYFDNMAKKPEFDRPVLVKSYTGRIEVAKYQFNENGINLFDKEKELSNFTVEYWRELF